MAVLTHKPHTVYVKSTWAAAWAAVPYLYANSFSFAAAPDTSDAQLEYHYGQIMKPGLFTFATYTPTDLVGQYVKIAVTNGPTWYGIIVDVDDARNGGQTINGGEVVEGTQLLLCRGFEYLLQRTTMDSSVVKSALGGTGEVTIGRAIGFNLGEGLPGSVDKIGNRSNVLGNDGTSVFAESLQDASEWQANQILKYLIKLHAPRNEAGADLLGWFVNEPIANQTLASLTPTLHWEGKTLFQVLNELIDRRRLMGWWIYIDPADERPEIRLFTFNRDVIFPPGGGMIINNQDQQSWDFDQENQIQTCLVATDDASKFHRVLAKGEPPTGTFTVEGSGGGGNGLLEPDWDSTLQTEYLDADTSGGFADDDFGINAHQTARGKDRLKKVFRYWRISPTNFNGIISGKAVWPYDKDTTGTCLAFWWPGLRLMDKLPLRLEHNYEDVETVTDAMKTDSKWVYQRPFVYASPTGERSFFLDRPGKGETIETHIKSSGRYWAASLQMQDNNFGIIIDVHGDEQHVLAEGVFTPADDLDDAYNETDIDYNYLRATVCAEGDGHVTCPWPEGPIGVAADTLKELNIYVPGARLDYLVPGTTIDIDVDGTLITSTGGFVRDDTAFLKNVARAAYQWYSTPRKSMQITTHELGFSQGSGGNLFLGTLITTIGGAANTVTLNSVITRITFDTRAGTSTHLTQFAEFDFT